MSSPIRTYDELLLRKKNLEILLKAQEELIKLDIEEIKYSLAPLHIAATNIINFFTRDKTAGLLGFGANRLIDVFIKKILLSGSNWLTKLIVPFFIKNFSSHFIAEHQEEWMNNIKEWFSSNEHQKERSESESEA